MFSAYAVTISRIRVDGLPGCGAIARRSSMLSFATIRVEPTFHEAS